MVVLKTLLFTVMVPGTVTVLFPYLLLSSQLDFLHLELGWLQWVGLAPIVLGGLVWCAGALAFIGRGTPAPIDPPKTLVVRGPYRFVRNPMYVGVWSVLIGEAVFFESAVLLAYSVLVLTVFHLFVVLYEEPTLRRLFGDSYERYCDSVPRWVPRLRGKNVWNAND